MNISPNRGRVRAPGDLTSLVARTDLHSLVESYSGQGRASGSTVTYPCPNPAHPDRSPSFTVTTRGGKQLARCWSQCDWSGDALDLVKWLEGLDTTGAADYLRARLGEAPRIQRGERAGVSRAVAPKTSAPVVYPATITEARRPSQSVAEKYLEKYLRSRGWPLSVVERHGLEVVVDTTGSLRVRHPYRVPNSGGGWRVAYYQDRDLGVSRVKWLSPRGASPVPYNLESLEREDLAGVVVCEGPADTITAELALEGLERVAVVGVPGSGAWRAEWGRLLDGLRVVIAADNDPAGEKLAATVRASVRTPVALVRWSRGDLTETALEEGLAVVREVLLAGLSEQVTEEQRTLEESVRLLLEVFPEAREVIA